MIEAAKSCNRVRESAEVLVVFSAMSTVNAARLGSKEASESLEPRCFRGPLTARRRGGGRQSREANPAGST